VTKEARQERRELWAERIEAFLASGLSQRAWCREHGVNANIKLIHLNDKR